MSELRLLIVEDDQGLIDSYQRDIKSLNLTSTVQITPTIEKQKDSALNLLESEENLFDAAIVDLKLDESGKEDKDFSGNEVLKKIKGNLRFPVFVVTGTPQHVDEELKEENCFFRIKTRGEEDDLLEQLISIYNTGITNILGKRGQIEKYLNNIFWTHLSNSMDMWIDDETRDSNQKEKSLLRYTLLHINEYIDEDIEKYHPNEFYITKPIKKSIFTGDIVKYKDSRYLVLTPSCDIVLRDDGSRNAKHILFCKIRKLKDIIENYGSLKPDTGTSNSTRKRLERLIQNNGKQNFHFIPKNNSIDAGLIDFQDKVTIPQSDVNRLIEDSEIERVATVSLPFLKDIISRYSSYYARQGSPDFDTNEIYRSLFRNNN